MRREHAGQLLMLKRYRGKLVTMHDMTLKAHKEDDTQGRIKRMK